MITAPAKATMREDIMTIWELLQYCDVRCVRLDGAWIARGRVRGQWFAGSGADPLAAFFSLLRKIGGGV